MEDQRRMGEPTQTPGEILFEHYLATQDFRFEFEREHAGKSKKPDYTIEWRDQTVVFDVKDFDPLKKYPGSFGYYEPYTRIREKIEQGRDKFKQYKEFCCGLVLRNLGDPFVSLHEPDVVLGAMYGDSGFTFPVNMSTGVGDASKMKRAFLGRGKMFRPHSEEPQNTTISALITLSLVKPHYQLLVEMIRADPSREIVDCEAELARTIADYDPNREVPRVIVWHNAVARIPFPNDLFCGLYDTHFGIVRLEEGAVEQAVTYRGSALPQSTEI